MKPLVVANWKCNPATLVEAKALFDSVIKGIEHIKNIEVVICPPFVYLPVLSASASAKGFGGLRFGSQDCCWQGEGAYTGEVSAKMAKSAGCAYIIIGHSERRKHFGETDEIINKKIKAAKEVGLKVILCVGETEMEKNAGKTKDVLERQLKQGMGSILNLIVAYEPVWAIGSGNPCGAKEAGRVKVFLQAMTKSPILYGGSVDSRNASGYIKDAGFDGLLVGGASLVPEEFIKIIKNI